MTTLQVVCDLVKAYDLIEGTIEHVGPGTRKKLEAAKDIIGDIGDPFIKWFNFHPGVTNIFESVKE